MVGRYKAANVTGQVCTHIQIIPPLISLIITEANTHLCDLGSTGPIQAIFFTCPLVRDVAVTDKRLRLVLA